MAVRERLLTPQEVASVMRVHPKTVAKWAHQGKLTFIRTPGNRLRFWEGDVHALAAGLPLPVRDRNGNVITPTEV